MISIVLNSATKLVRPVFVMIALLGLFSSGSNAQKNALDDSPIFREYRGVQIGMTTEETRKKLGSPKDKADDTDFFVFNDLETAQIGYDKTHKVTVLSVDFVSGATGVPTPKTIIGTDLEAKADGSMYKMIRYAKAGFWVSYSRTGGDSPMVSITIQKIE
jgi:hypothetical protein